MVVARKLRELSSMGHFLSNTEYRAQPIPAEIVHISPLLNCTAARVARFPLEIIKIRPAKETKIPIVCLTVIRSLKTIQETITINIGIIEFIKTVFVTVDDLSAKYIHMLKLVTEKYASRARIFQFCLIKSF